MISLVDSLEQIPLETDVHVLTIGNFDGMHLGHQAICKRLVAVSQHTDLPTAALTFSNHPSEILRPHSPALLLCTPSERYRRLQQLGVTRVIALPFSTQIAQLSAEDFLKKLNQRIPFQHLVLGHDATIGKGRAGNREVVQQLAKTHGFHVYYEPAFSVEGQVVSSTLIREAIRAGRLHDAARWLGREYSLSGLVIPGLGQGRKLGFPTINVDISRLCLPPFGVYGVRLEAAGTRDSQSYRGIANIGIAPTVRQEGPPILEVHLKDNILPDLSSGWVNVVLEHFIRPEKKFDSLDALKAQITSDITWLTR